LLICQDHIYRGKESNESPKGGFTKPSAYYRVTRSSELQVIINHFDKYPLQSKKKFEAYKVWREMVVHKIDNFRNPDYDLLHTLASKLSSLNLQSRAFRRHKR